MYAPQEIMTLADASEKVNALAFPHAVDGESVKQFGYWFDFVGGSLVARPNQPCLLAAWTEEQAAIAAELEAASEQPENP